MSNEMKIKARDLLSLTPTQILEQFGKTVTLVYDDGQEVVSTTRKAVYSWFIWEFHRRYPQLPLTADHHVDSVLKGQLLSSNTHIDLLSKISKQLILSFDLTDDENKEEILELIYYITNQLYNELPKLAGRYVATLDILDILELAHDPEILDMKAKLEPNSSSIADFYAKSQKILLDNPKYRSNNLVQFLRMGILNNNQVNQCILARGYPIEVTGQILQTPIRSNYAMGMVSLYDYVADSRGAAKHLYSAEAPLQDTEYFARRLQLASMVVEKVVKGDCGSTQYLPWLIKPPTYTTTGRKIYGGDLVLMIGKMYKDEETGMLKEITGKETHLYGKTIAVRSVLFCTLANPHHVCATCFGGLHHNVSRFANLGHLCSATVTQKLTQSILGTKHLIGSAVGTDIKLKEDARRYLSFSGTSMAFHLKPPTRNSKIKLIVNRNAAIGLTDIKLLSNISQINPRRISALTEIEIQEIQADGMPIPIPVVLEQGNRNGYFSYEFLCFVKEKGWTINEYDHFVFDMTDWNPRLPMIRVPDMEYSYSDHANQIANLIESNTKRLYTKANENDPVMVLQELFDLTNSKINAPLALLEVMVYANMTPGINDFGMARNIPGSKMHVAQFIISNRSMGPAYAYQKQFEIISNPRSFFAENRPDSPIDVFIAPREVVAHKKRMAMMA